MTSTLGVLMIEDEGLIILAVKTFLRDTRSKFRVTESFSNVNSALEKIKITTFDIIVLDLWLKNENPIVNVTKLKRAFPDIPIVVFTSEGSEEWNEKMLKKGVAAFVSKSSTLSELKSILHKAYCGETIKKTKKKTIYNYEFTDSSNAIRYKKDDLSILQKEIIELLSQGLCLKEIGDEKCKTTSYINQILIRARKSFHVRNNAELVKLFYS